MKLKTIIQDNKILKEDESNINDKYVIEVHKNSRYFFVCIYDDDYHLTWLKTNALTFDTPGDAEIYIAENDLRGIMSTGFVKNYKIIKYSETRNH